MGKPRCFENVEREKSVHIDEKLQDLDLGRISTNLEYKFLLDLLKVDF